MQRTVSHGSEACADIDGIAAHATIIDPTNVFFILDTPAFHLLFNRYVASLTIARLPPLLQRCKAAYSVKTFGTYARVSENAGIR